jgi:hypothetical protein
MLEYERVTGQPLITDLNPGQLVQPLWTLPNVRKGTSRRDWTEQVRPGDRRKLRFETDKRKADPYPVARTRNHSQKYDADGQVSSFLAARNAVGLKEIPLEYPQVTNRLRLCKLFIAGKTDYDIMDMIEKGKLK